MRELISQILLGLFSYSESGFNAVAAILMIVEACLSHIVILKVKYTEIDWSTYMQQVECYVNKGIMNYSQIGGDTGPIVYPAGHIFIYRILYFLTSSGTNIRLAQHIFQVFYLFNVFMVFRIFQKMARIPPIVLLLVTVTGYRIHSIFVLRLFNDPLAMMLFYVAMDRFLERKWTMGCVFYSLAVSIKMNVLLFAPALFFTLLLNNTFTSTLGHLALCGMIQLYLGGPFLIHDWRSYINRSFDLGRVFMFKWTVNWRFLPEELFLDKRFHIALLVGHLTFLAIFAYYMWFRRLNGLPASLYVRIFANIMTTTGSLETFYAFCTSNLIGIAFSRSLHYQFYSWYFHQLPFLLFCDYPTVTSVSSIPWRQFFWKVPLLLAIELCWNVYPSTWWSSGLLHICHVIIFWHLIRTRVQRPRDMVSREERRTIGRNQEMLRANCEKYGSPMPNDEFEDDEEEQEMQKETNRKMYNYKDKTPRERRIMFEDYYGEQMVDFKEDNANFEVYKTDSGEVQVMGIAPQSDKTELTPLERIHAVYAKAITRQRRYTGMVFSDSEDSDEEDGEEDEESSEYDEEEEEEIDGENSEMIPLDLSFESTEISSSNETDQSDECTEAGDSDEEESMKSSEGSESEALDEEDRIYEETLSKAYDSLHKYRHLVESPRRDLSV